MSSGKSNAAYNRTPKGRYRELKRSAKRKGRVFTITLDDYEFLLTHACAYCGITVEKDGGAGYWLDRIDNDLGYTVDNILPCCGRCNRIRGADLNVEQMFQVGEILKQEKTVRKIKGQPYRLNLNEQRDFRVFIDAHIKASYWQDAQGHIMEAWFNAAISYYKSREEELKTKSTKSGKKKASNSRKNTKKNARSLKS